MPARPHLVVGLAITGQAVARALVQRGETVVAVDDRPGPAARATTEELGIELVTAPERDQLAALVAGAAAAVPTPGLPDRHPLFELARAADVPILSEFDLVARWDQRPLLAVTGTDGKTTVTTLIGAMLEGSGVRAGMGGNNDVPLVQAIEDPTIDVFVVEASSFRLDHSQRFAPQVGTWLNFAPDHLDNHRSLAAYEAAKARIWRDQTPDQVAVAWADDPVVAAQLDRAPARHVTFGAGPEPAYRVVEGLLVAETGDEICRVDEMPRALPHDVLNALAAAATALNGGATLAGVRAALLAFRGLPHRVALVGEAGGVRYVDDSKATTPHAVLTAVSSFDSVVLICGGRNKGLDLGVLTSLAPRLRAVVAIGDAASEVVAVFSQGGVDVPVQVAASMDQAVQLATSAAQPGDTVLLSPGGASYDWYRSYVERGDDFIRAVQAHVASLAPPDPSGGTAS